VLGPTGSVAGHVVQGVSPATSLTTGLVTVSFSGAAAFTASTSYTCVGRDSTNSDVAAVTAYVSGTSVTFDLTIGADKGHTVTFFCVGS
jgi:hypothetical protein